MVIITVHGIRTFGQWQQRLETICKLEAPSAQFYHYNYGYFSVLAFLFPPLRYLAVRRFARFLSGICDAHPAQSIDLVAHSFGTHLVGWSLYRLMQTEPIEVRSVILAGSVLRVTFPWQEFVDRKVVQRVVNDCGVDDSVLILSQLLVLFTGMAGRLGFHGGLNRNFLNRYFEGGHSFYFLDGSRPDDTFMSNYWRPIILNEEVTPNDARQNRGPIQGLKLTLLQIADPVKLFVYGSLVWFAFSWLYFEPKQREIAAHITERLALGTRLFEADLSLDVAINALIDADRASQSFIRTITQGIFGYAASAGKHDSLLRYWMAYLKTFDEALPQGSSLDTFVLNGARIFKSGLVLRHHDGTGIESTFHDPLHHRFFLYESNGRLRAYNDRTLEHQFSIDMKSLSDDSNIQTPGKALRLFASDERFTIGFGYTESSMAGAVELLLFVVDHVAGRATSIRPQRTVGSGKGYLEVTKTKDCLALVLSPSTDAHAFKDSGFSNYSIVRYRGEKRTRLCIQGELGPVPANALFEITQGDFEKSSKIPDKLYQPRKIDFPAFAKEQDFWNVGRMEAYSPTPEFYVFDAESTQIPQKEFSKFLAKQNFANLADRPIMAGLDEQHIVHAISDPSETILYYRPGGEFEFCRLDKMRVAKGCVYGQVTMESEAWISPSAKFAVVQGTNYLGYPAFAAVDLNTFKQLRPDVMPASTIYGAKMDMLQFSVTTSEGQLWIYDRETLKVARRVDLGWRDDPSEGNNLRTVKGNPLRLSDDGSMTLIDGLSGEPIWLSRPLSGSMVKFAVASNEKIIVVMNNSGFARLIDAETGMPLTRVVQASEICPRKKTTYQLRFTADQRPAIDCDESSIAVRRAPLDDQAFRERLTNMSRYVVPHGPGGPKQLSEIRKLELPGITKPALVPTPDISAKKAATAGNP